MQILMEGRTSYADDPPRYFDFGRFADEAGDFLLCEGLFDFRLLESLRDKKVVYLEFEEPNRFFSDDLQFNHIEYEDSFYKIFTLCPYTAAWLNRKYRNDKRTPIFFPFNENYIPVPTRKTTDVIYTGNMVAPAIEHIARDISKFNYKLVSLTGHALVTHRGVSYTDKLKLIAESKITVVHNLLHPNRRHLRNLKINAETFEENEAFKALPRRTDYLSLLPGKTGTSPQLKSRPFEAAFCRSLILCERDMWNVIERYFEPEQEFVYYEPGELVSTLRDILSNFDAYEQVIENAFNRAVSNYTTVAFFQKYLKDLV